MTAQPPAAVRTEFPHAIREIANMWIPLSDGTRLAARIWLAARCRAHPVPAILEYLPYRKDDGTALGRRAPASVLRGPRLRVPCAWTCAGTGDSDGLLLGEYLQAGAGRRARGARIPRRAALVHGRRGDDRVLVGRLQRAAGRGAPARAAQGGHHRRLDRRPLPRRLPLHGRLHARLRHAEVGVVDARATPSSRPTRSVVGDRWREMWLERLEHAPELARDWVSHQRRDEFWIHGSIARGLLGDAMPGDGGRRLGRRVRQRRAATARELERAAARHHRPVGPHDAAVRACPGPLSDSCRRRCAGGTAGSRASTPASCDEPMLRAWIQEPVAPATFYAERPGRWVGVAEWPAATDASTRRRGFALRPDGTLVVRASGASDSRRSDAVELLGRPGVRRDRGRVVRERPRR